MKLKTKFPLSLLKQVLHIHFLKMQNMRIILCTVIVILLSLPIVAQVQSGSYEMAHGMKPGFELYIAHSDSKWVEKEWRDYMSQYGKVRKVKRSSEYWLEDVYVPGVSGADRADIYGRVESSGGGSQLVMWIDLGPGYLNPTSNPEEQQEAEKIMLDFEHHVRIRSVELELEEQEKQLSSIMKDYDRLVRDYEGYERDIERAQKAIEDAKQNMLENEEERDITKQKIGEQEVLVRAIRDKLDATRKDKREE